MNNKKNCTCCKLEKDLEMFSLNKGKKTGRNCTCKKCVREKFHIKYETDPVYKEKVDRYKREYYIRRKKHILNKAKKHFKKNKKEIKLKQKKYYLKNRERFLDISKEYRLENKEKIKQRDKKYRKKNRKKLLLQAAKYRENNREKLRAGYKIYKINNKEKVKKRNKIYKQKNRKRLNKYAVNKRKTDIQFCLKCRLRQQVCKALRGNSKSKTTLELLGCTIQEFKKYLESKFQPGMTWENRGLFGWHIDHIRPCSSFLLEKPSEQRKCFHYTNLQPL